MNLALDISVNPHGATTLGSLEVTVRLENRGLAALVLPGPQDQTAVLTLTLVDPAGHPVQRMNGFSSQAMMSGARLDTRPDLASLGPGEAWSWTLDLASYQYAPPAGDFELEATYEPPSDADAITSPRCPVHIAGPAITRLTALRDNPVLDGLTLLFETKEGAQYLRLHGAGCPLAAWYSVRLDEPGAPAFFSTASFFQTDSFDPFFHRWVIWERDGRVEASLHVSGLPTGERRSALLPTRGRLLRSAFHTASGEVFLSFQSAGCLDVYRLERGALAWVFAHALPVGVGRDVEVRADDDGIHLLVPFRGLLHDRLDFTGRPIRRERVFRSRLQPHAIELDPVGRVIKAIFRDGPLGRTVQIGAADLGAGEAALHERVLPLRGRIEELAFDRDPGGELHLLVSTSRKRLYYLRGDRAPRLIAAGEEHFLPRVVAVGQIYLGCHRRSFGYRFLHLGRRGGRVVDYALGPWS
jgi:hypothetical protein